MSTGARVFSDPFNNPESINLVEDSFDYTMETPDYEFGDDFEFDENNFDASVFTESIVFDINDYVPDGIGAGFMRVKGQFKILPVFEASFWELGFALDLPQDYFNTDDILVFTATYAETTGALPTTTVQCSVQVGNPQTIEVREFDESYDASAGLELPFWERNYEAEKEYPDYRRSYDNKENGLKPSVQDGRMNQGCVTRAKIDPEDAEMLYGLTFDITVKGQLFSNRDATESLDLPEQTYQYTIDAIEMPVKELEDDVKDAQVVADVEYVSDGDEVVAAGGQIKQRVKAALETNPLNDEISDDLSYKFELEGKLDDASIVYQFLTARKIGDDESKPISVGCRTKVNDPWTSRIDTFKGYSSMDSESSTIAGKTVDAQNADEKAKKAESFKMTRKFEQYATKEIDDEGTKIQPCFAKLSFGKKLQEGDDELGQYEITLGARIFVDEEDTEPKSIPTQTFTVSFEKPVEDLASLHEEDEPEDFSETLQYLKEKSRFQLADVFTDIPDVSGRGFQVLRAGYKLYGSEDAKNRWYFNLGVELPTEAFPADAIVFQYLKYQTPDLNEETTGAIGCKVQIGDLTKSEVNQWKGVTDLDATSPGVAGKKWYQQAEDTETGTSKKMDTPEYEIRWYNEDVFALKQTERRNGSYSVQQCEVELKIDDDVDMDTLVFDLEMGFRLYRSNDAKEFYQGVPKLFDWRRVPAEYSEDLEEPPAYREEDKQVESKPEVVKEIAVEDAFAERIARKEAERAAAEQAAASTTTVDNDDGTTTTTVQNEDGSTTSTTTDASGNTVSTSTTVTNEDGTQTTTTTDADGNTTEETTEAQDPAAENADSTDAETANSDTAADTNDSAAGTDDTAASTDDTSAVARLAVSR